MHNNSVKEIHQSRLTLHNSNVSYRKQYIDPNSNNFFPHLLEKRNCPVCKKDNEQFIFYKDGGRHVKCNTCAMIYLNPVFTDKSLEKHYRNNTSMQGEVIANDGEFYTKLYTKGLDALERTTQIGNILDIGCSAGGFLDIAKTRAWNTYGIELNEKEAAFTAKRGHQVYNQLLQEVDLHVQMDAISLWDVFEHLKDPYDYLNQIKNMLTSQGTIFLQIPTTDSLAAKILQEKCNMFDGIEHVNLYSYKSIQKLTQACGLEILSYETVISEIGVLNNYLNYDDPYFGETQERLHLLNLIDEKSFLEKNLGYKMQLVLGKIS